MGSDSDASDLPMGKFCDVLLSLGGELPKVLSVSVSGSLDAA